MKNKAFLYSLIFFLFITFNISNIYSQQTKKTSYSNSEKEIFNQINKMRTTAGKTQLLLSDNLSYVAKMHIEDLKNNYKSETGCSMHSWSDKGNWTACCNAKNLEGINCMKIKPNEITGYDGMGFELIFWDNQKVSAKDAIDMWNDNPASKEMILCTGKWSSFNWSIMGVAVDDNYIIVWFGDRLETLVTEQKPISTDLSNSIQGATTEILTNESSSDVEEVVDSQARYHIVVSSLNSYAIAKETVDKYKKQGYPKAHIINNKSMHRIVIESFKNEDQAREALKTYKTKFEGCWLLIL